jgi:hypothetical protein
MIVLVMVGFCIYGPQVLLVGTAPADLAHRGTSAAAAGFVNFLGYMGAATGDVVTGYYSIEAHGGWQVAIRIWAGWALAGAVITAALWNTTSRRIGVLPGAFPKIVALVALAVAGASVAYGDQPTVLRIITIAGTLVALATLVSRWGAVPVLIVAATGLLTVFARYIQEHEAITWDQTTAMAAYGLAMVASLMILVERKAEECASSSSAPDAGGA